MSKVAIVIDSTTTLPKEMMAELAVRSAPATIIWSGEELRDGIDIQPSEFYARLALSDEMPTTSQATPAEFKKHFDALILEGYDILSIVISSKLSGMYDSAMQARNMLPDATIEVIDSLTGAMAIGLSLPTISQAAEQGLTLSECKEIAENALNSTGVLFTVDTLEYLHRGGRIGGAQKFLGTALNFKPILEIIDGAFEGIERVRTRTKALNRLVELLIDRIGGRVPVHLAAMHANAYDRAAQLNEMAGSQIELEQSAISEVSPAVGVHLGPGAVGFAFMAGVK